MLNHILNLNNTFKDEVCFAATLRNYKNIDFQKALSNRIALSIIGLGLNETFSDLPFYAKIKKISVILHDPMYIKAYQNLDMKYFPLHWKLFFYLAKSKNALGVLSLSYIMNFLIKK